MTIGRAPLALVLLLLACKQDAATAPPGPPPAIAAVYFGPGSNRLSFDDRPAVDQAVAELGRSPALHVLLIGRTDSRGNANSNMQLGLQRARELRDAILLRAQGKVDAARVHIGSRGQAEPTGDNNTDDGRAANRRVEFYFYYPDGAPLKPRFVPPIVIEGED